jgi:hypothetical protein
MPSLMEKAQRIDEARVSLSQGWLRLAGQLGSYHAIMREHGRIVRR